MYRRTTYWFSHLRAKHSLEEKAIKRTMAISYHVRSISLPSRSHPITLRVEEELNKLKKRESSAPSTSGSICDGLSGVEDLYKCIDDLLSVASAREALSCGAHAKYLDELLEGSVKLLDVCSTSRDILLQINEQVKALQSAFRRRKGDSSCKNNVANYISFVKKMKKEFKKLLAALKQMDNKIEASPLLCQDHKLFAVVCVFREVSATSSSIFQSLLSFLSATMSKPKESRWSLVSRIVHKEATASEGKHANLNELETLEISIGDLENGLERVFRCLIKTRSSLLNLICH